MDFDEHLEKGHQPDIAHTRSSGRRFAGLLIVALLLLVVVAGAHIVAVGEFAASATPGPVGQRLAQARLAATIEPWQTLFRWRVVTLQALDLFDRKQVDSAYFLLLPYTTVVRGDAFFRQVYQEMLAVKAPLDSRKAHVQHALEGPGGILSEKNVQR